MKSSIQQRASSAVIPSDSTQVKRSNNHLTLNPMVLVIASDQFKLLVSPTSKRPGRTVACNLRLTDCYLTFTQEDRAINNNHNHQHSTTTTADSATAVSIGAETADFDESDESALLVSDIIGCHLLPCQLNSSDTTSDGDGTVNGIPSHLASCPAFTVYAYPLKQSNLLTFSKSKKRIRVELTFIVDSFSSQLLNLQKADVWVRAINWLKHDATRLIKSNSSASSSALIPVDNPPARHLLVLINPASGSGRAGTIYKDHVAPLLAEAGIKVTTIITQTSGSARNHVTNAAIKDLTDGIVIVSGDGLIFEVINGLMDRDDRERAIKIPLGVIPGGSGNGLAHSVNYAVGEFSLSNPVLASTLNVIRGESSPLDLVEVTTPKSTYYSFLSIGYGLLADMDIESERLRCLGGLRFALWAIIRTIGLRKYKATLSYLPVSINERIRNPFTGVVNIPPPASESASQFVLPQLNEPLPDSWTTIEGEFIMIYSGHVTHMASDCFLAPNAKLNDGAIWLVILPSTVTRVQVIQFLLALESGKHCDLPYVTLLPVRAFRLVPASNDGYITVDGELIEFSPIQARVIPAAARVMTR